VRGVTNLRRIGERITHCKGGCFDTFVLADRVQRAPDAATAAVEDVGVDHRGRDVAVVQELLDGANVVAVLEEVRNEAVAQRVARGALGDARGRQASLRRVGGPSRGGGDGACGRVAVEALRRENEVGD
jgi:hypothetical protein